MVLGISLGATLRGRVRLRPPSNLLTHQGARSHNSRIVVERLRYKTQPWNLVARQACTLRNGRAVKRSFGLLAPRVRSADSGLTDLLVRPAALEVTESELIRWESLLLLTWVNGRGASLARLSTGSPKAVALKSSRGDKTLARGKVSVA